MDSHLYPTTPKVSKQAMLSNIVSSSPHRCAARVACLAAMLLLIFAPSCSKPTSVKSSAADRSDKTNESRKVETRKVQHGSKSTQNNLQNGQDGSVALLVVDVQQDFFDPQTEMSSPGFVSSLTTALDACRTSGIEVIHIRTAFPKEKTERPKSFQKFFGAKIPCIIGSPGIKPLECARQHNGEKVFYKKSFDPFENKEFADYLAERKIEKLLICGLTTDVCVLSTSFSSTNKGFITTLVEDCCAAGNPMAHQFVIKRYGGMIFDTVKSSEIKSRFSDAPTLKPGIPTSVNTSKVELKP